MLVGAIEFIMYLTRVTFTTKHPPSDDLKDVAEWYLSLLLLNGQICGDYLIAWSGGVLNAYTHLPRPDAFRKQFHSKWGRTQFDKVVADFGDPPQFELIDDSVPKRFASWKKSSSLYLFTHAFDDTSPVCCGDTGEPIPI